jgi:hypothetical protein
MCRARARNSSGTGLCRTRTRKSSGKVSCRERPKRHPQKKRNAVSQELTKGRANPPPFLGLSS